MLKRLGVAGLCAVALSACAATRSPSGLQQQVQNSLVLVERNSKDQNASYYTLFDTEFDTEKENEVANACNVSKADISSSGTGNLAEGVISFVVGEIAGAIEDYTATYGASIATAAFYRAKPRIQANFGCFRFTRGKTNETPDMEVIGKMKLAPDGGALVIRPLRVYFRKQAAKYGSEFGVAIGFKINATWQENGVGKQSDSFYAPFFSTKVDMGDDNRKRIWYPGTNDTPSLPPKFIFVPVPSWTTPSSTPTFGNVLLSVSVAEVGKLPWHLKLMQSLIADNKNTMKDVLKEAANKALRDDA